MDKKSVNFLDGSKEDRTKAMKEFFGLSPEQSFQDLDVDISEKEDGEE